jgi:hypothetical protein
VEGVIVLVAMLAAPVVVDVPPPRPPLPHMQVERGGSDDLDLQRLPGGRFRRVDREGGFVATIEPDGSVEFESLPQVKRARSRWIAWFGGLGDALQREPGKRDRPELEMEMPQRDDASRRAFALGQTVNWGPYGPPAILLSAGGSFGVSGPNEAKKREFMRDTKRMRDAMAVRWREKQLDAATVRVTADVVAIWRDESLPLSIRKERIFALWDEAEAPAGDGPLQDKLVEVEIEIRDRIERAVARLAPEGSDDAFTDRELADLNGRRGGRERFDPYGAASPATRAKTSDSPKVPNP